MVQVVLTTRVAGWRQLLVAIALLASLCSFRWMAASFDSPQLYQKDFVSGYLLAKTLRSGGDPYLSVQELGRQWMPQTNFNKFNHPSPHTIAIGWLCTPFTLLPYEQAALVWLAFELICLVATLVLLVDGFGLRWGWGQMALTFWLVLGWAPVMQDLCFGQFSIILLLMLVGAWRALRQQQDWLGGALLGGMLTLKLAGWPIILYLLLRGRWRAVGGAAVTALSLHGLAVALHGWTLVRDYYLKIGPQVTAHYHWRDPNSSLWTFGQRLFAEYGNNFVSEPLWHAPQLARALDVLVPVTALAVSLWFATRLREFDAAFGLMASLSAIINPVAWTHYLLFTAIAIGLIWQRLHCLAWPRQYGWQFALTLAPFCVTHPVWSLLALSFSAEGLAATRPAVPLAAAWLTVTPTLAVLALCWLLWRVTSLSLPQTNPEQVEGEERISPDIRLARI